MWMRVNSPMIRISKMMLLIALTRHTDLLNINIVECYLHYFLLNQFDQNIKCASNAVFI